MLDHVTIRVADRDADVAAAKRFYGAIARHAGLRLGSDTPERVQFRGRGVSFSIVAGTPTEHVHVAFPAPDDAAVEAFHRARRRPATATTAAAASGPSTTRGTTPRPC